MPSDYTPVSNVEPQAQLTLDLRDITAITLKSPIDWSKGQWLYEKGANSKKGDGNNRSFMGVATKKEVLAVFPQGDENMGTPDFLNAHAQAAIAGSGRAKGVGDAARRQLLDKSLLSILYGEILEELDAARLKIVAGQLDVNRGAPHNVDEAWAYYVGAKDSTGQHSIALASTAGKRERNFKLEGKLDAPLQQSLAAALKASQSGDVKAFDIAAAEARGYLNSIFYLASLRYVSNLAADTEESGRETHSGEAWGFFQTIKPAVASVAPLAAKAVEEVYSRPANQGVTAADVKTVYAALNDAVVVRALGIPKGLVIAAPPA